MDALHGGWDVFTTLVRYLALAVGAVLPFALAAALVAVGVRVYRRFRPATPKAGLTRKWVTVPAQPSRAADSPEAADSEVGADSDR